MKNLFNEFKANTDKKGPQKESMNIQHCKEMKSIKQIKTDIQMTEHFIEKVYSVLKDAKDGISNLEDRRPRKKDILKTVR